MPNKTNTLTKSAPKPELHIREDYAERYGFHDPEEYFDKPPKGVSHEVVEMISRKKKEPAWMRVMAGLIPAFMRRSVASYEVRVEDGQVLVKL